MTTTNGGPPIRYAAILDTETTGVDPSRDHCIEVAVQLFDVKRGQAVASFASLIRGDANAAEKFNHIPADMLPEARDADEVWRCVKWLISPAQVVIAHSAEFDRQFCPPLEKPWCCSMNDMKFPGDRESRSLVQLALSLGLGVASAHRAMSDVDTLSRVLSRVHEMGHDLEAMIVHGLRPKLRCVSLAPFEQKDVVKAHGFAWDSKAKHWWRDVPMDDIDKLPFKVRKGTMPEAP
jgi:DNA polymerase III subunit epsilon